MNDEAGLPPELEDLADVVAMLSGLSRSDRIETLIGLAEGFREVPERVARRPFPEASRVPACESQAFVFAEPRTDGTLDFHFAVENPQGLSAKAFGAVLARTLSGRALAPILALPADLVESIFGRELSLGKSLGLAGMLLAVQRAARDRLSALSPSSATFGNQELKSTLPRRNA
ncbi:MAG: SufE family protein [Thermoanaerobaculia bacterium]